MTDLAKKILIDGIRLKMVKDNLSVDEILESYSKLTNDEKIEIRNSINS